MALAISNINHNNNNEQNKYDQKLNSYMITATILLLYIMKLIKEQLSQAILQTLRINALQNHFGFHLMDEIKV